MLWWVWVLTITSLLYRLCFFVRRSTNCEASFHRHHRQEKNCKALINISSGAGTNLKVGGTGPKQKWGHRSGAKRQKKNLVLVVSLHFLALKLVVLVSAIVIVSRVWSVSCLLFSYSWCPPCPAICKSGWGHVPPVPHGVARHWT